MVDHKRRAIKMTSYGTVQIGGKTYMEREQNFPLKVDVTVNGAFIPQPIQLPGIADFWLKTLTRETLVNGAPAVRRFLFRLGNSDGATWYSQGGVGGTQDMVLDSLMFGSGQFPFVLNPYIYYSASANINVQIQDISNNQPYTIQFDFRGSYLIPAE